MTSFLVFIAWTKISKTFESKNFQDWEDFYGNNSDYGQQLTIFADGPKSYQTVYDKGSIYIKNSLFSNITSADYGGAIKFQTGISSSQFLVEDSQFNFCYAQQSGGALYIKGTNSVLSRVCGFDCNTLMVHLPMIIFQTAVLTIYSILKYRIAQIRTGVMCYLFTLESLIMNIQTYQITIVKSAVLFI